MPTPSMKTKIAIDGEKAYKQALSEINSGLKVLSSEMKLATAQFSENSNSVDELTQKGSILERQILSQREKIEMLNKALQNSAEESGEASTRTSKWKVSLNEAEAELIKMERALEQNKESLRAMAEEAEESQSSVRRISSIFGDAGAEAKGFGDLADDLAGKLGVNLPDGAKGALNALGGVSAEMTILAGGAAAAAAAIAKVESALIDVTRDQAAYATELYQLSETVNINVEALQTWDYVLKTVGSSIQEAQGDLSAFQEKIRDAASGTGEASELFMQLGVSVFDQNGKLRETEAVLTDVIHSLMTMNDETERNAISSSLLGGTGEKLIPIYSQNAEALEYLLEKKRELGVLNGDEIETLRRVSEALMDYEEKTKSANNALAVEFAPTLAAFYEAAGDGLNDLGVVLAESGIVGFFASLLELITALTPAMGALSSAMELLAPVFDLLSISISAAADGLNILMELFSALFKFVFGDGEGAWDSIVNVASILTGANSATKRAFENARNSTGNQNFGGGYTWVGENGPELAYLPRGTRIFNNQESRDIGGDTFYVTIDARNVKEFNDIVEMAKAKRRIDRMG